MKMDGPEVVSAETAVGVEMRFSCCFRGGDDAAAVLVVAVEVLGGCLIRLMIPYREWCFLSYPPFN